MAAAGRERHDANGQAAQIQDQLAQVWCPLGSVVGAAELLV